MTIDPKAALLDVPLIRIRDFLRSHPFGMWRIEELSRKLRISSECAARLTERLVQEGYIERDPEVKHVLCWRSTAYGTRLASAHAARPISRKTANTKLKELIARAERVNGSAQFAFVVERITVIGSYLSESDFISDVDVVVSLEPRFEERKLQDAIEAERRKEALATGRRFGNFCEEIGWPETEVNLFLKSRSRSLQFVSPCSKFLLQCEKLIVFERGKNAQQGRAKSRGVRVDF